MSVYLIVMSGRILGEAYGMKDAREQKARWERTYPGAKITIERD